jgi:membrane-anchored glycerophosphoryl diester phosphodiesterase (GDPDase)
MTSQDHKQLENTSPAAKTGKDSTKRKKQEESTKLWVFIFLWRVLVVVLIASVIALLVYLWHNTVKESLCWLSNIQLIRLQIFFGAGFLSGTIGLFLKFRLPANSQSDKTATSQD